MEYIEKVECPVCGEKVIKCFIETHVEACLDAQAVLVSSPFRKKQKIESSSRWDEIFKRFPATSSKTDATTCTPKTYPRTLTSKSVLRDDSDERKGTSCTIVKLDDDTLSTNGKAQLERVPTQKQDVPLAELMRPDDLEFYFGQEKIMGPMSMLRTLIETMDIPSMILWGPPGCGKTTLAHIIAKQCRQQSDSTRFIKLSATACGVGKFREIVDVAKNEKTLFKRATILFMDEIHRFNKLQQDTFLPYVETGTIILIGATTENPSFSLNNALLSRCKVFVLEKLSVEHIQSILLRTLKHLEITCLDDCGHLPHVCESPGSTRFIEKKAVETLASLCDGDARAALNGLQMTVQALKPMEDDSVHQIINEKNILEGIQRSHLLYDRVGEEHYNSISALHKSLRGSDENAALYWLARMMMGGEDPLYVARRLIEFASEDIGLADPNALVQAVATYQACHFNGVPECKVNLAQCVVYLARASKSIEVHTAYMNAEKCISNHKGPMPAVPLHLRNAPTNLMKNLGYGTEYKYNPACKGEVKQKYFPDEMPELDFFTWKPKQ